jgi:hypothetical protein
LVSYTNATVTGKKLTDSKHNSSNMRHKVQILRKALFPIALTALAGAAYGQVTLPTTYILPVSAADTSKPGFIWNVSEVTAGEPNSLAWAESQLAGAQGNNNADPNAVGAATGSAAGANPATAPISFVISDIINFSIAAPDSSHVEPNSGFPDEGQMPGLPGTTGSNDNIAAEALTYLNLPAGPLTMVVRSDDGFRVSIGGAAPGDKFTTNAVVVGQYDGGRGAADTSFNIVVPQAGLYAARLLYENGGGDANVEWFTLKADGTPVLVNDTANGGIPAYRAVTQTAGAFVSTVLPSPGSTGVSPTPTLTVVLQDGATAIDGTKVTLTLNGAAVTPTISRSGKLTTVTYVPTAFLPSGTVQTASVAYFDGSKPGTVSWSFTTAGYALVTPDQAVTPDTSKPGFKFNVFANSNDTRGDNDLRDLTEQALNGALVDSTQTPLANLANPSAVGVAVAAAPALATSTAAAQFEIAGTVALSPTTIPGLPATDGQTDGIKGEFLTYVSLPAGLTTFGVTTSDQFRTSVGSFDYTKATPGGRLNQAGASDNTFFVLAPTAGVYPLRVTWIHKTQATLGFSLYTVKANGSHVLVNDTANGGLAAYRAVTTPVEPYIKYTSPSTVPYQIVYPKYAVTVGIADGTVGLDDTSVSLTIDGNAVSIAKARVANVLYATFTPTTFFAPSDTHTAVASFKDKAGKALSETWNFMNLKALYFPGTKIAGDDFESYPQGDSQDHIFNPRPFNRTNNVPPASQWGNPVQPDATKWYVYNYSDIEHAGFDLTDPNSDSYLNFVVVDLTTFSGIEGDVLNAMPGESVNGQPVTAVGSGNAFMAESDNRSGSVNNGQVQFAISKSFDLSSAANPVVAFAFLRKQNQDDTGGMEYSVDGGTNWAPVIYTLDGDKDSTDSSTADYQIAFNGTADAVGSFTAHQSDAPIWTDYFGKTKGGNFGDALAAPITPALAPFIAPRVNDSHNAGIRYEAVRLPLAAHKSDVRLRMHQLGTCSWYTGFDEIAFYDIPTNGAQVPTGLQATVAPLVKGITQSGANVTVTFVGGTLESATSISGPFTSTGNNSGTYTTTATGSQFFRVRQ